MTYWVPPHASATYPAEQQRGGEEQRYVGETEAGHQAALSVMPMKSFAVTAPFVASNICSIVFGDGITRPVAAREAVEISMPASTANWVNVRPLSSRYVESFMSRNLH